MAQLVQSDRVVHRAHEDLPLKGTELVVQVDASAADRQVRDQQPVLAIALLEVGNGLGPPVRAHAALQQQGPVGHQQPLEVCDCRTVVDTDHDLLVRVALECLAGDAGKCVNLRRLDLHQRDLNTAHGDGAVSAEVDRVVVGIEAAGLLELADAHLEQQPVQLALHDKLAIALYQVGVCLGRVHGVRQAPLEDLLEHAIGVGHAHVLVTSVVVLAVCPAVWLHPHTSTSKHGMLGAQLPAERLDLEDAGGHELVGSDVVGRQLGRLHDSQAAKHVDALFLLVDGAARHQQQAALGTLAHTALHDLGNQGLACMKLAGDVLNVLHLVDDQQQPLVHQRLEGIAGRKVHPVQHMRLVIHPHRLLVVPALQQPMLRLLALGRPKLAEADAVLQRNAVLLFHVLPLGLDRHRADHDDVLHAQVLTDLGARVGLAGAQHRQVDRKGRGLQVLLQHIHMDLLVRKDGERGHG